nr:hypothetical protein [Tanacetum cinerariifolium]
MDEGVADKLKKRKQDDVDKDESPSARSDRGLERQKTSKDIEPSKKAKSTETSKGTSKGTSKSQPKSTDKFAQVEETVFEAEDTQEPHNQGQDIVDFRPHQTWISKIAQAEKPPLSFDELMSTLIDFSAYVMNNLKINNLTQEHIVGPAFNLLKWICRSHMELEYNFKECYNVVTDRLDWNNPEGKEYTFDLSKPLPLIMNQVTKVKVMKWYDYGYLEDIEVRREYQQLYKFKEDVYQKKLNITKPETFRSDISNRTPYTAYNNRQGIIYVDKYNRNRMDYLPKRRWSNLDRQRSRIMIKAIDKLLLERRLMRILEKFIGGRDYEEDFRLLERTI